MLAPWWADGEAQRFMSRTSAASWPHAADAPCLRPLGRATLPRPCNQRINFPHHLCRVYNVVVSLLFSERFRGMVAMFFVALVLSVGLRPALAGSNDQDVNPPTTTDGIDGKTSAETRSAPRLQLQDEGPTPTTGDTVKVSSRARVAVVDDTEERPFWKSWIFWTITGALVVGAVGLAAYSSSHSTSSSLAPCPVDVAVSLGCFGAGRGQ
jgi:hypothetical protein